MDGRTKIPTLSRILSDPEFRNLAFFLKGLNEKWEPHDGQRAVGEHIFVHGARRIFLENGRKWGKSDFAADVCWRLGNMIRGGQGYYFGAYQKAVRELMWANRRLQDHGPKEYVTAEHQNEMRLTFTTNTFVKCDGADEFKLSKGFNPDFVVLDEFADYPEDFWIAMSPNFASKDTIVVIISSPPWELEKEPGQPVLFVRLADLWKKYQQVAETKGLRSKYIYVNQPTHTNPHIPKPWLNEEREALIAMGMEDVWQREYEAKRVTGAGKRIIGTFSRERHVKAHDWIMKEKIEKHHEELIWLDVVDPAVSSVFAGLVMAINPYSKEVFWLDEHYSKEDSENTSHIVWPILEAKENELYPEDLNVDPERFQRVYDEAETWFAQEVTNDFGVTFNPTEKVRNPKEFGISLLRSVFRYDKGYVSDRCKWLIWELENWRKDKFGAVPDRNNHTIDCSRYGLHAADYFLSPEEIKAPVKLHPREDRRLIRIELEQEIAELEENFYGAPVSFSRDNLTEDFDA